MSMLVSHASVRAVTPQSVKHVGCQSFHACASECLPDFRDNKRVFGLLPQQAPVMIAKRQRLFLLFNKWLPLKQS